MVLTPIILACLPSDMRMEWAREEKRESDLDCMVVNVFENRD